MEPESLKKALAALHRALQQAPKLDEQSRQLVRKIMNEVEGLGASPAAAPPSLHRNRLEEAAVGFEVEHPSLAAGLRQLIDLLGKAGL
jgi:hypothetical protein